MSLDTRTKDVKIEGTTYRVREPSAAEFSLYLQTRIDTAKPKAITIEAVESADRATAVILQRCIIEPAIDGERASQLASNSVYGLALMAAIMGLGSQDNVEGPPEKEPNAG